jgi:hypothetical protein
MMALNDAHFFQHMAAPCCSYVPMLSDNLCLPRLRFGLRHQFSGFAG